MVRLAGNTLLRVVIVCVACTIWLLSLILPIFTARVPAEPGIGVAVMGVLGAALAFPEIENISARRRKNQHEKTGTDGSEDE